MCGENHLMRQNALKLILYFLIFLFQIQKNFFAAPLPATSSSSLISPEKALFISPLGFQTSNGDTEWVLKTTQSNPTALITQYKSENSSGSLSIRIDRVHWKTTHLKAYVKTFINQYPRLGFDILSKKYFNHKGDQAFVIDLVHFKEKKQLRQVVFMKRDLAVIMTCRDQVEPFKKTLLDCNKIIKTFQWNQ